MKMNINCKKASTTELHEKFLFFIFPQVYDLKCNLMFSNNNVSFTESFIFGRYAPGLNHSESSCRLGSCERNRLSKRLFLRRWLLKQVLPNKVTCGLLSDVAHQQRT